MQFRGVGRGRVGQVAPLEAIPDVLDGVQVRCVAWQRDGLQSRRSDELGRGVMHFPTVPDHDDAAAEVIEQIAEERDDVFGLEVAVLQRAEVEAELIATRGERQRGHHRHFLPMTTAHEQLWGLTARSQSPPDQRVQQEAALVDEHNGGPLAARPF